MPDIKSLLKQYEEVNAELNAAIRKNGKEFMTAVFSSVFDSYPELKVVVVRGFTPSFNDGEPCEHSHEVFTGYRVHSNYSDSSWLDFDDYCGLEDYFEYDDESGSHLNLECPNDDLHAARKSVEAYDELIERVYHTNFDIVAKRLPDGSVEVTRYDYWCDY